MHGAFGRELPGQQGPQFQFLPLGRAGVGAYEAFHAGLGLRVFSFGLEDLGFHGLESVDVDILGWGLDRKIIWLVAVGVLQNGMSSSSPDSMKSASCRAVWAAC